MPSTSMPRAAISVAIEDRRVPRLEAGEGLLPIRLAFVAVNGRGRIPDRARLLHHAIGASLCAREDQSPLDRPRFEESHENLRLVCVLGQSRPIAQSIASSPRRGQCESASDSTAASLPARRSALGHRRRKENRLPPAGIARTIRRTSGMKPMSSMRSASSMTKISTAFQVDESLIHQIEQPARRCDENVDAVSQGASLAVLVRRRHKSSHGEARYGGRKSGSCHRFVRPARGSERDDECADHRASYRPGGMGSSASRWRIGNANAAVLPVPVWAVPRTSRPASRCGMDAD